MRESGEVTCLLHSLPEEDFRGKGTSVLGKKQAEAADWGAGGIGKGAEVRNPDPGRRQLKFSAQGDPTGGEI